VIVFRHTRQEWFGDFLLIDQVKMSDESVHRAFGKV
jgi:hypothetical protein